MHLFLRDVLRLSTVAVLAGAILYTFVFWHPIYGFVVPGLPLLWLLDGASRPAPVRWRFLVGRVLWIAFILYNGQSQTALLVAGLEFAGSSSPAGGIATPSGEAALWLGTWLGGLGSMPRCCSPSWLCRRRRSGQSGSSRTSGRATPSGPRRGCTAGAVRSAGCTWYWHPEYLRHVLPRSGRTQARGARAGAPTRDRRRWFLIALLVAIPVTDVVATIVLPQLDSIGFLEVLPAQPVRHFFPFALVGLAACGTDILANALSRGEPPVRGWRTLVVGAALVPVVVMLVVVIGRVVTRTAAPRSST